MTAVRLLLGLAGGALILCLLGYAVSRNRVWLRNAGFVLKAGIALITLLFLVEFVGRLARVL